LALEYPEARFTLCDSIGKKVRVAGAVADGLGLGNVRCVQARAEELGETFDWVVTRAVASLDKLYPWVKGRFRRSILCLKGGDVLSEISELGRRCGVPPGRVRVWSIEEWLNDDYFKEKFVIEVGKDYLCPPKSEN
ncbi:MAG: class I SAM-dependent methyltransferase, partial [Bacteroidales bacterium]|nr:class I SAM-dependent methyltransferase [Bacteroidales bacterium]